jgi:hypothetical protein
VQLGDLRSAVLRETISLLDYIAENHPTEFSNNCGLYFRDSGEASLLKLLNNGKRVLSDMAHESIVSVLSHVCIPK